MQRLKSEMTLDFGSGMKSKKDKFQNLLSSPDLNLLKLASPELEKMIIQHNGMVTTTPTPTQFICPKYVTEEQEAYARGFVDALAELHKKQGPPSEGNGKEIAVSVFDVNSTSTQTLSTTTSLPGAMISSSAAVARPAFSAPMTSVATSLSEPINTRLVQVKQEEPQCVPCLGSTPPLSPTMAPINMENQEKIKLERKRARNRVAARKCRTRKLERISRLEDRVSDLKDQNSNLSTSANTLRDEVCRLKQQIMDHVQSGCPVMLSQNLSL